MNRSLRRIWGFGVVGWMLLPVAAALTYCALGGFDLTHALLQWWYETMGWRWLLWLAANPALYYYWSLQSTLLGPISLTYLLLSLHVAPRRWCWWVWCLAVAWTLAQPALWWHLAGGWSTGGVLDRMFGTHATSASAALLGLGSALGVWLMARSRWVLGVFVGVTAAAVACEVFLNGPAFEVTRLYALQTAWHCAVGSTLVGWAVIERRRAIRETGLCLECGYDLAGNTTGVCPECGHTPTATEFVGRKRS